MRNTIILFSLVVLSLGLKAGTPGKPEKPNPNPNEVPKSDITREPDSKRWKSGFIVTLKGDTILGKVKTMDFLDAYYDYQRTVSFKDAKGTAQYTPNDLKSFSYMENPASQVTLQAVSSPKGDGKAFLRLYYSGQCKVYGLTDMEVKSSPDGQAQASFLPKEEKYIQIKNSQFYPIKRANFKKNMREIFASYPHIVAGLDSKQYTYDKWEALVRDYNKEYK